MTLGHPLTIDDLLSACQMPDCPVCTLQGTMGRQYIQNFFESDFHNPEIRIALRMNRGFCKIHAWEVADMELDNSFGPAVIYHDLLVNMQNEIQKLSIHPEDKHPMGPLERILSRVGLMRLPVAKVTNTPHCPVCVEQDKWAQDILHLLIANVGNAPVKSAFLESAGLCFPHARQAVAISKDSQATRVIISATCDKYEALRLQITDYIRANETKSPEKIGKANKTFWPRVIGVISGYYFNNKLNGQ